MDGNMNGNEKGFNLFWQNYQRASEWQNNSRLSQWKARAYALEAENAVLRDFIHRELQPSSTINATVQPPCLFGNSPQRERVDQEEGNKLEDSKGSFHAEPEIDEALLAFYEQTMRHKIERNRRALVENHDQGDSQSENEHVYSMGPISTAQKSRDMTLLYGNDASKIFSMELSMQINFDMNCNKSNAQLWPNIPLRLS